MKMSAIGKFRAKSDVYKSVYLFNLMYILYRLMIKTKNHIFVSIFFFFFSNPFVVALIFQRGSMQSSGVKTISLPP